MRPRTDASSRPERGAYAALPVPDAAGVSGATPRIFVAGAGAVGAALAGALHRSGWPLAEIASRTRARSELRLAQICGAGDSGGKDRGLAAGEPEAVDFAELCAPDRPAGTAPALLLIAVPDRVVPEAAAALARRRWPAGSVALHTSGAVEVSALAPLRVAGLAIGGLHPLRSFVDLERDVAGLANGIVAIEGDAAALELAERVVARLGARPFRLAAGMRPAWHAAASHACNHLVALLDQSLDLLAAAGLDRDTGRAALLPLQRGTLDNLAGHAPSEALTGPIVRGDVAVVRRHLAALAGAPPDVAAAYRALGRRAVALARARGLADDVAAELLRALQDPAS